MAMVEDSDVEMDEQYHDLSPKRKEIVDAWAELYNEKGEEPKNVDVMKEADANESYVSQTLSEYKYIAEARADKLANQREEGTEETTGDPFQGKLDEDQGGYQTIQERPNKGTDQQEQPSQPQETKTETASQSSGSGFTYEFSPEQVRRIAFEGELPEELATELQQMVVERAFDS